MANPVLRSFRESLGLSLKEFAEGVVMPNGRRMHHVYLCQVETQSDSNLGRDAGLAIVDAYRRELAEARITLEDLLRGESRSAA